jgi:Uncharacterized ABC-type transport system, permease component
VVFGQWQPWRSALGALLFALIDALQLRLQASGLIHVPYQVFLMLPFVLTIVPWRWSPATPGPRRPCSSPSAGKSGDCRSALALWIDVLLGPPGALVDAAAIAVEDQSHEADAERARQENAETGGQRDVEVLAQAVQPARDPDSDQEDGDHTDAG